MEISQFYKIFLFALIIVSIPVVSQPALAQSGYTTYQAFYEDFRNMSPDLNKIVTVSDFFYQKDCAAFEIESGEFYFLKPLNGKVCAAVFVGKGRFSFTPPTRVEKEQLERMLKQSQVFDTEFESLVFFFSDSTYYEITKDFPAHSGVAPEKVSEVIAAFNSHVVAKKYQTLQPDIAKMGLEPWQSGIFYAMISKNSEEHYFWTINPFDMEEIGFHKTVFYPGYGNSIANINQFNKMSYYENPVRLDPTKNDEVIITHYDIDAKFSSKFEMETAAKLKIIRKNKGSEWVHFYLLDDLIIESIKTESGDELGFYKPEKISSLWINVARVFKNSDTALLTFRYNGKVFDKYEDILFLKSSITWYPAYNYKQKCTFDLTYSIPDHEVLISVGRKLSEEKKDGAIITKWKVEKPHRNISFNIAKFTEKTLKPDSMPVFAAYDWTKRGYEENILQDAAISYGLYKSLYGDPMLNSIIISSTPSGGGEAFPGMINISTDSFWRRTKKEGWDEMLVSHEVSHQWFAIGVDFVSYRDQWLSEGFAEYSCLLYMQKVLKGGSKNCHSERSEESKFLLNSIR